LLIAGGPTGDTRRRPEATADRGYGSAAIIRTLQEAGTTTYIPLWSGRVGNSKHLKGELVYERAQDHFQCPQAKYLNLNPAIDGNQKRYSSSSADCRSCEKYNNNPAGEPDSSPWKFDAKAVVAMANAIAPVGQS
jgi:hypothetical protein